MFLGAADCRLYTSLFPVRVHSLPRPLSSTLNQNHALMLHRFTAFSRERQVSAVKGFTLQTHPAHWVEQWLISLRLYPEEFISVYKGSHLLLWKQCSYFIVLRFQHETHWHQKHTGEHLLSVDWTVHEITTLNHITQMLTNTITPNVLMTQFTVTSRYVYFSTLSIWTLDLSSREDTENIFSCQFCFHKVFYQTHGRKTITKLCVKAALFNYLHMIKILSIKQIWPK